MRTFSYLLVLATTASLAAAVAQEGKARIDPTRRLIKTSEDDKGRYVTEEQKITEYVAKDISPRSQKTESTPKPWQ
jgi:leucyl aminopeptidase